MSINNFSSISQETLLWSQQQYHLPIMENHHLSSHDNDNNNNNNPNPNSPISTLISLHPKSNLSPMSFNLNHENTHDDDDDDVDEEHLFPRPTTVHDDDGSGNGKVNDNNREFMFEKPLTPSDVGKLNRLVIPKQYAEKYFPLAGAGSDKGLLLSFEDEAGKFWRFRYSYWNSSQSYVLTKGWSRYVKEKRLDAGDVVVFERHRLDIDRLFIGWKRRTSVAVQDSGSAGMVAHNSSNRTSNCGGWTRMFYSAHPYPAQKHHHLLTSVPFQSHSSHAESSVQSQTVSVGNSKILRLFGVNLECQTDGSEPEPPSTLGSSLLGRDPIHHNFYPHSSSPLPDHMDFTLAQDVKKKRNHRG